MDLVFGYPKGNIYLTNKPIVLAEKLTGIPASDIEKHARAFGLIFPDESLHSTKAGKSIQSD